MSKGSKTFLSSAVWSSMGQMGGQALQFITTLVLARLLVPGDFGVVAMANTVTLLVGTVNQLGISPSIVQKKEITDEHLSSAFWLNLAVGTLLGLLTYAAAIPIGKFYHDPLVIPVLATLALTFPISSTKVVHSAMLVRSLRYQSLFVATLAEIGINGIVAIMLAINGFAVWSLVLGRIAGLVCGSITIYILYPWCPRLTASREKMKELMRFGLYAMGVGFLSYFIMSLDNIIVGRYLGAVSLGVYGLAYNIVTLPQKRLSSVIAGVAFPYFSRDQDDKAKVSSSYLTMLRYLSFVVFPVLGGLCAVAPEFVHVVLGERWVDTIVPLRLLCMAGISMSVGTTVGSVFFSMGRPDIEFKLDIISFTLLLIMLFIGVRGGIIGVALTVSLFHLCLQWLYFQPVAKLLGIQLSDIYRALIGNLIAAGAMSLVVVIISKLLQLYGLSTLGVLCVSVAAGILIYGVIAVIFRRTILIGLLTAMGLPAEKAPLSFLKTLR